MPNDAYISVNFVSDNVLSFVRHQATIWTNVAYFSLGPWDHFQWKLNKIETVFMQKNVLKMSSAH